MNESKTNAHHNGKRLARLAAVQALYQMVLLPRPVAKVIEEFRAHPEAFLGEPGETPAQEIDQTLFGEIVSGVSSRTDELDGMIAGALDKNGVERLEILLRSILRAGVFELYHQPAIPAGVIINDYVDVAHAFFDAKEPGLVNGILDKLAKGLRAA